MAYKLAMQLKLAIKFNQAEEKAGYKWLQSFLRRRTDLSIRKSENTSTARAKGMSREVVTKYFQDLESVLTEYELFDKPGNVYNTDETGLQLNTKAGLVIAEKGSKAVSTISPGEKGETISVLACCNAEGGYLPPYCIFKGKNKKDEWSDGMPPGSQIQMSEKSAYVNSNIFFDWLRNHFYPRKGSGKVLLLLDGHTSHTSNVEMLEFAEQHDIILFCLPPHTTH
ncbi:jerky protein homolog-like [Photinus pyralis]|nr:jerky protein homolog-like [Photinus pyralis]